MASVIYYAVAAALLALAYWHRRDVTTIALALGLALSIIMPSFRTWPEILAMMAAIDAATVLVMGAIWTRSHSMRAWSIGFIGLAKTGWTLGVASEMLHVSFFSYAVALNCGFLLQVIVSGGFFDAVGHRLDDLLCSILPRRHRLLRDGGR